MPIHGLDKARFKREYWQNKALLIRQGFVDFECPVNGDDLAGLACEDDIESRLITRGLTNWSLRGGPFTESDFSKLPASDWTLLVQRVDHWIPEVADLIRHFDFLPRWRIDDVMVSYAAPGGGVGPHFDNYDVFLVQGSGRREWRLGQVCDATTPTVATNGLQQLEAFQEESRHVLEPGDILYVPPGLAHWGTALDDDCITLSVGFRAPSSAEILGRWADEVIAQLNESERYRDTAATLDAGNSLNHEHLLALRELLQAKLDDDSLIKSFGELVTETATASVQDDEPLPAAGEDVFLALDARLTCYADAQQSRLFANGQSIHCVQESLPILRTICNLGPGEIVPNALWLELCEQFAEVATFLLGTGALSRDSDGF